MILPSAVQCAGRTAPARSISWKAPFPPIRASTTTASPRRTEKCALSPVSRERSSRIGVAKTHHFHFVERAGRKREQRPADAISLEILHLSHIAERDQGLDQMECRRIVQSDTLGKLGQSDAVTVARDFFHDGECARERLHAAARLAGAAMLRIAVIRACIRGRPPAVLCLLCVFKVSAPGCRRRYHQDDQIDEPGLAACGRRAWLAPYFAGAMSGR